MGKKKRYLVAAAVVLAVLLFGSGVRVGAATAEPGGMNDPLITESYLTKRLNEMKSGYECVTVSKGKTLSLKQGAYAVLYTGSASVTGSMIDVTGGSLATAGTQTVKYHSYLAPADGSGFTANSTCVVFLCGEREE